MIFLPTRAEGAQRAKYDKTFVLFFCICNDNSLQGLWIIKNIARKQHSLAPTVQRAMSGEGKRPNRFLAELNLNSLKFDPIPSADSSNVV